MANAAETEIAIYDAVTSLLAKAEGHSGTTRSAMVRDAAIAFRAAYGGPQPGSVVIEK